MKFFFKSVVMAFFIIALVLVMFWVVLKCPESKVFHLSTGGGNDSLTEALIVVESGGELNVIGDRNLRNKAYGCLQVRQPACDDVNRRYHTSYRAEQCLGNRELSIQICTLYLKMYATSERLGRTPTDEDRARIWNGGPNGYKKASTESYWNKVHNVLRS